MEATMAWKRVANYNLGYNVPNKQFSFYYELAGELEKHQMRTSPIEFLALSDMFRNEGPILYNTVGKYFCSNAEEI
jgi:hypothetical protein